MPARKTIAERRAAMAGQRRRTVLLALGAIPIVILLVVGGFLLYDRATSLGPNELPSSIGSSEREDIQAAVENFYDAVNQHNPQLVSETMRWDEEYDSEDLNRLVFEISALLSENLQFEVQTLGATTLDREAGAVSARVATNFGAKDLVLRRRGGDWRVARLPDLSVPQEAGPVRLEWEVSNSFRSDDGTMLNVTGSIRNTGDRIGFMLGVGAYIAGDNGKTLAAASQPLPGSPFIQPGEVAYFQVTLREPEAAKLAAERVTLVPDFRQASPSDRDNVAVNSLSVTPESVPWPSGAGSEIRLINSGFTRPITSTRVYGELWDASGRLLGIVRLSGEPMTEDERVIRLPDALPRELTEVAKLQIRVYAASRPLT